MRRSIEGRIYQRAAFIKGNTVYIIAPSLQALINKSLLEGKFPKNWKSAKGVALFKSGDKSNCDNYRPISVLPTISKIIERAVHKQFYESLQVNSLQALLFYNGQSMDKGHVSGVVYLDLKKAFDTIDHSLLLLKLTEYGVSTACLKRFRSYLIRDRSKRRLGTLSHRNETQRLEYLKDRS